VLKKKGRFFSPTRFRKKKKGGAQANCPERDRGAGINADEFTGKTISLRGSISSNRRRGGRAIFPSNRKQAISAGGGFERTAPVAEDHRLSHSGELAV